MTQNNLYPHASQSMSSREIAMLCEKEHRNVCRDIDNLNTTYEEMGLLKIEQGYYTLPSTGNQQHREFYLTKEQCIDLISGYRTEMRIRINRRWQELERLVSSSDYQSLLAQNHALKAELLKAHSDYKTLQVMFNGGLDNGQMGLAVGLAPSTVSRKQKLQYYLH